MWMGQVIPDKCIFKREPEHKNTVTVTTLLELTGNRNREFNVLGEMPRKHKYFKIKLGKPTAKMMTSI